MNGTLRTIARRTLPSWLQTWLRAATVKFWTARRRARFVNRLARNYWYDYRRYARHSADKPSPSRENLRALIAMDAHRIEKGLALREPRAAFGMWFIPRLIANVVAYQKAFGPDRSTLVAGDVLAAYARFNSPRGGVPAGVQDGLAAIRQLAGSEAVTNHGGVLPVSAEELRRAACRDLQPFFGSRHSVRQFADAEVPREAIEAAVSMAMHTPSVCNRQSWRVHAYTEPELKAALLKLQNGNRGFGDQAAHVLVVTTDLETFTSVGERNQCWIDGGMFSMSLIWALHSLGLGTCCLNWSVEKETDAALREVAAIPESQAIMMMIAVGALPQTLTVARSLRRQPDDVLVFHTGTGPS